MILFGMNIQAHPLRSYGQTITKGENFKSTSLDSNGGERRTIKSISDSEDSPTFEILPFDYRLTSCVFSLHLQVS